MKKAYPEQDGKGGGTVHTERARKRREKDVDHGDAGAVNVNAQTSVTTSSSSSRPQQQRRREQMETAKKDGNNNSTLDPGDVGATNVVARRAEASADRKSRRHEKGVDQGDTGAILPSRTTQDQPHLLETQLSGPEIDYSDEFQEQARPPPTTTRGPPTTTTTTTATSSAIATNIRNTTNNNNTNEKSTILSDGGDVQPRNFRPRELRAEDPDEEEDDDDDDEDDDDLVPGAYNVTTDGINPRHRGRLTESQRFSDSNNNNAGPPSGDLDTVCSAKSHDAASPSHEAMLPPMGYAGGPPPDTGKDPTEDNSERRSLLVKIAIVCLLVVVVVVAIAVPMALSDDSDDDDNTTPPNPPPPTTTEVPRSSIGPTMTPPTMPPTWSTRTVDFMLLLDDVSDLSAFQNPNVPPQAQAIAWLADVDPARLDPINLPYEVILERYVMALLFFSWIEQEQEDNFVGFLTAGSVCGWNDGVETGVFCDQGRVAEIKLSELVRSARQSVSRSFSFPPDCPLSKKGLAFCLCFYRYARHRRRDPE
jgi:hypothetical protein